MLAIAEVTKLAASILAELPVLKGIQTADEHEQALALMDALLEDYDANLVVIEALSNVIARYEDQSEEFEEFNNRQAELDLRLQQVVLNTFRDHILEVYSSEGFSI